MILYKGASRLDQNEQIVVIATFGSKNAKTGNMVQVWILHENVDPIKASRTGKDFAICGNCPYRGIANPEKATGWAEQRTCYVNLLHGPLPVYKAYKRGNYSETVDLEKFRGKFVRFGAYGDPLAVPEKVWTDIKSVASGVTSYTHSADFVNPVHMISVDNKEQAEKAKDKGFRYFRVTDKLDLDKTEILCPASEEGGRKVTCNDCRLCDGSKNAKNIVIVVHGIGKKNYSSINIANI